MQTQAYTSLLCRKYTPASCPKLSNIKFETGRERRRLLGEPFTRVSFSKAAVKEHSIGFCDLRQDVILF